LRLDRRHLRKHRQRQIEARQKCKELRAALLTPGLPIFWVVKAREAIDQVERELLEPLPPYEAPDLLP
jgi:hypothetical protein